VYVGVGVGVGMLARMGKLKVVGAFFFSFSSTFVLFVFCWGGGDEDE